MVNEEESDGKFQSPTQAKPLNTNSNEPAHSTMNLTKNQIKLMISLILSSRSPSVKKDFTLPKENDVLKFKKKDGDQWTEASVISREGKAIGKYSTFQSISKWEKLQNTNETMADE